MHYRCTIQATQCSQAPSTFLPHTNVPSLGYVVRRYPDSWDLFRNTHKVLTMNYSRQVNYLIGEAVNTGKGANLISMLHHFLATHNLGEAKLHLHADNCSGQNKNLYVMQYLTWRVLSGLNKQITLSFLVVGHTKFSLD